MGLVGVIDPRHSERKADEPGRLPRWIPREELLQQAATWQPSDSPWPYELLAAAMDTWQDRDYLSTSMFSGCARGTVIERREDFIYSVDDMYAALKGTLSHTVLEYAARPNSLAEARFFTTITIPGLRETVELSCSPDIITWNPDGLGDYKTTQKVPQNDYPKAYHTKQVQFNAWLVRNAERWTKDDEPFDLPFDPRQWSPEELYLVYIGPEFVKTLDCRSMQDTVTPKGTPTRRRLPDVWDDEKVESILFPKVKAMAQALASYPEWPFGDEFANDDPRKDPSGFAGPPGWACPGPPYCWLPRCMAKRYPNGLYWENEEGLSVA